MVLSYAFIATLILLMILNVIQNFEYENLLKKSFFKKHLSAKTLSKEFFLKSEFLLSDLSIRFLMWIRIMLLVAFLMGVQNRAILSWGYLIANLLLNFRFRGGFNGGSDHINTHLSIGLVIGMNIKNPNIDYGLVYIASVSLYSYFKAGLVKIKHSEWRRGVALRNFYFYSPEFHNRSVSVMFDYLKTHPKIEVILCWLVLAWELTFPIVILNHWVLGVYLSLGLIFHFMIYKIFSLNRFFWAWVATYPSLTYINWNL